MSEAPGLGEELEALLARGAAVDAADLAQRHDAEPDDVENYRAALEALSWGLPPAPDPLPDRLARYELRGELARGGAGVVQLAWDPEAGREVVIKLLRADRLDDVSRERFQREVRALKLLRHPHVARVLDAGVEDRRPFVVMERAPGESLRERLRRGTLEPAQAGRLALTLATALQHVHEQGLLHRDVKPANVVLGPGDSPRLVDFGLVRDQAERGEKLTLTGHQLGTPGYWAPEQAAGSLKHVGPATDVYGLGATLYACLTGVPPTPSEARSPVEAAAAAVCYTPASPSELRAEVPRGLERICLRCLEKDPADRYASAARLAEDLDTWLLRSEASQRKPWLGLTLAFLLAGGGVAAALVSQRASSSGPESPIVAPDPFAAADAAYQSGDREAARRELQALLERDPGQAEAHRRLAALAQEESRFSAALLHLERAIELEPDSARLFRDRALVFDLQGDRDSAVDDLRESLRLEPGDPVSLELLAQALVERQAYAQALEICDRGLVANPERAQLWALRAVARGYLQDLPGAIADADKALLLDPDNLMALRERGSSRAQTGDTQGALEDLDRVVEALPDDGSARWARAATLGQLGRLDEALADATHAYEQGHKPAHSLSLRARVQLQRGDLTLALADCRHALELKPGDERARGVLEGVLAALHQRLGQLPATDPARADFERLARGAQALLAPR